MNIYIAGYVADTVNGESYTGGASDAAVFKLDSSGNILWVRLVGTNDEEVGTGGLSLFSALLNPY